MRKCVCISAHILPPEVWLRIHRWATFVPNAFDKDVPDPFSYPPPLSQDEIQDQMRRSLKTKRSLVLVCKLWNELSTRFLYEAVYVGLTKTVLILACLLVVDLNDEATNRTKRAMKLWTRRLDYAIRNPAKKESRTLGYALVLRNFMPKLEFFVARKTDMQNLLAQKQLFTFFAHGVTSLTTFDSTHTIFDGEGSRSLYKTSTKLTDDDWDTKYNTNFWSFMLYGMGALRRLNIVPNMTALPIVREVRGLIAPLSFPNLQYLYLTEQFPFYVDLNFVDSSSIVATHSFHLVLGGFHGIDSAGFLADYIIYSPGLSSRLTTFEWRVALTTVDQQLLDAVAERCPNLQNLLLVVFTWRTITNSFPSTTLPKSVQRLGLRSYKQDDKRSVMRRLCDGVAQVSESAKSLRAVRFLDRETVRNLREVNPNIARQMKMRLDVKNISLRVEATDGRPLLQ